MNRQLADPNEHAAEPQRHTPEQIRAALIRRWGTASWRSAPLYGRSASRAQLFQNTGQKMEGEKGREGSGGGVSTNQPELMEERGAEETLTDSNAPDKTPNQTSERLVCVLSGPWKPRLLSPRYIYTDLHTNSTPSTLYLRLRAFSITWICGTHGWTANVLFNIYHSSAATVGTNPPAEADEEVSGPGNATKLVNSASEELNLIASQFVGM